MEVMVYLCEIKEKEEHATTLLVVE